MQHRYDDIILHRQLHYWSFQCVQK